MYLCINAHADTDTKFNIEFTSDAEGLSNLAIDSTTTLKSTGKVTYYQLDNSQEIYVKITRNSGFPFVNHKLCKPS